MPLDSFSKAQLLVISFASFISIGLQGGALGVAWLSMQSTFGVTLESLGILLTATTIGSLLVSFYSGAIVARLGIGAFCFWSSVLSLLGIGWTSVTAVWAGLVGAAFLMGVGRSGINAAINTFIAANYPSSRMNWLHALFGVGSALGPLLVTFVVVDLARPWQYSYWFFAAVQLLITLAFFSTRADWQLSGDTNARKSTKGPSLRSSLGLLPVWLGVFLFISHTGLQLGAGQLTNNLFVEGRGIDPKTAGLWISLFWAFITLGRLVFGMLIDQLGTARVLRFATAATVLGAVLLWWNPVDPVSFLGIAIMGFTLAPVFPSSVSRVPALVGHDHSPNTIGVQMAGAALGSALLPGLFGYIGDNFGLELIPPCLVALTVAQFLIHEAVSKQEQMQLKPS